MAPYTPNAWVNDGPPPLSASHLNKICDELVLQAAEAGISPSLPTWVNDGPPALTDAVPLNQMENLTAAVATVFSLSYAPTVWSGGWVPSRNATRLNRLEAAIVANRVVIDARTPLPGLSFPAAGHKWGGNEQTAMGQCELVIADPGQGNPNNARVSNPSLVAFVGVATDPLNPNYLLRRGFQFTYGGGYALWPGGTDAYNPSPGGTIRAYNAGVDAGCMQSDGLQGFHVDVPEVAGNIRKLAWYGWKKEGAAALGYNGIFTDNFVPGNVIHAGWFYGSACPIVNAAWDVGLIAISQALRGNGVPMVGGNVGYKTSDATLRSVTHVSELETLEDTITSGADVFAAEMGYTQAWFNSSSEPRYLLVGHQIPASQTSELRFGLALATILGGAYGPGQGDQDLYMPTEMFPRRRWGQPVGAPVRNGSIFYRDFQAGRVSANFTGHTATFPN